MGQIDITLRPRSGGLGGIAPSHGGPGGSAHPPRVPKLTNLRNLCYPVKEQKRLSLDEEYPFGNGTGG